MPVSIPPMPISPGERTKLVLLRGAVRAVNGLSRLRRLPPGIRSDRFRYGSNHRELGDVLDGPASDAEARTPVVYVHGGGWIVGQREMYARELCFLVDAGRPVANLDYPLAPEHPHPLPLLGLLRALAWLRAEDPRFERVHLMGDSAGGNLVMMLALWLAEPSHYAQWAAEAPADPDRYPQIASVVSLYGVLDRHSWLEHRFPLAELMLRCYGGAAAFEPSVGPELAITPSDLDARGAPPTWIGFGDADPLAESSRIGARHLEQAGVTTQLVCYPDEGHGFFNFAKRPESQRLRADVLHFMSDVDAARV